VLGANLASDLICLLARMFQDSANGLANKPALFGSADMPMMRAAVARAYGALLVIEQVPIPEPRPGEVLVKIVASGVCQTDLHAIDGDWPFQPPLPLIPGHEGVGHVASLGAGVTDLKEGDAVGVPWLHDACPPASIARLGGRHCASSNTTAATA
jgi:D-arabinose 1-dehydrogenase-like Zn-dependent alcohol dehydrogenase